MSVFVPDDLEVPLELATDRFRLEPLGPEHNGLDHQAWMSSIADLRATPGSPTGSGRPRYGPSRTWPTSCGTPGTSRFTFSVLDGDEVIGCVYLYPTNDGKHDVEAQSWVRASRAGRGAVGDGAVVVDGDASGTASDRSAWVSVTDFGERARW